MEEKLFTLSEHLQAIDNAYATGKANVTIEEKEKMMHYIKTSAVNWTNILKSKNEQQSITN